MITRTVPICPNHHITASRGPYRSTSTVLLYRCMTAACTAAQGKLYKDMSKNPKFGFLPRMAQASKGQIGALNAESFCDNGAFLVPIPS